MSQYTTMKITGTVGGTIDDATKCMLRFITSFGDLCTANNVFTKSITSNSTLTATINISSVTDSCYVGFTMYNCYGAALNITSIQLS